MQYASLLGDELNLRTDVAAQALSPDKKYMYDSAEKGLRLAEQGDLSADAIKLIHCCYLYSAPNTEQRLFHTGPLLPKAYSFPNR